MELTQEEIILLLKVLDQVSVSGTKGKRIIVDLMEKLETGLDKPEEEDA